MNYIELILITDKNRKEENKLKCKKIHEKRLALMPAWGVSDNFTDAHDFMLCFNQHILKTNIFKM